MRAINQASWLAVVVTNQAGVARGYFPESVFHEVQAAAAAGRRSGRRALRRGLRVPAPPLAWARRRTAPTAIAASRARACLRKAESELGADLQRSWVIGDRHSDMLLAWNVGARAALVKSGYGLGELTNLAPGWSRQPDLVAENLLEAVERILSREPA